jgi:hypothetical protein
MFREADLGPCQFRPPAVGGHAVDRLDERGARGLATKLEIIERAAMPARERLPKCDLGRFGYP